MSIAIRSATAQDYDDLCEILDEVDSLHREALPHLFQQPVGPVREEEYILELLADEDTGLFIAEAGGQVVGFVHVIVRETPPIPIVVPRRLAIVDSLVVKQGYRRRGIGRALMHQADRWALDKGATTIELSVFEFNAPARAFYQGLGYETTSRRMSRRLSPAADGAGRHEREQR